MSGRQIVLVHAAIAALAHVALVRALHQPWTREVIVDEPARFAFLVVLPFLSAIASLLAIWIGARTGASRTALLTDVAGIALFFAATVYLHLGPQTRDVVGVVYVIVLVARLAPSLAAVIRGRERGAVAVLALSLVWYAGAATWSGAATSAQGDQPHYLMAALGLSRGHVDLAPEYRDGALFRALSGVSFSDDDFQTHLVARPGGTFLVQGYGLALALLPGWLLGGKLGALLVVAVVAAVASWQTFVLCREAAGEGRAATLAWALVVLLAPMVTIASVVYPNALAALAIVLAYRWLFTAPTRRPALAALAASIVLVLTPRDFLVAALLAPFVLTLGRPAAVRAAATFAAVAVAVSLFDLMTYGIALPYAGYVFGMEQAQQLDHLPSLAFQPQVGLGGILFDRAFGLAGSAPFVFIGLAGIAPALRAHRARSLPALVAVAGSVAALSIYRLWQGGWSPPNRYLVDVLPLWAPFIALAIRVLGGSVTPRALPRTSRVLTMAPRVVSIAWRALAALLVALSVAATFFLVAIPNLAFNLSDTAHLLEALDSAVVVDPLAWLPSFEVSDPAALLLAWLRALPLVVACGALLWLGARRAA